MKKRLLSSVLAICMILNMSGTMAFADVKNAAATTAQTEIDSGAAPAVEQNACTCNPVDSGEQKIHQKGCPLYSESGKQSGSNTSALQKLMDRIDALPELAYLSDENSVEAALELESIWEAYDALSDADREALFADDFRMNKLRELAAALADVEPTPIDRLCAKIDALPNADEITEENREAATTDFNEVWVAYEAMFADKTITDLDAQLGAERMAKLIALRGELLDMVNLTGEVYAVYDSDSNVFYAADAGDPKIPTLAVIEDKGTITDLYIMGIEVPSTLMQDCANLKTVTCAETVKTIGTSAFQGCTGLTSIEIPNVTQIDSGAFNGCGQLANLTLGATPPTVVDAREFDGCAATRTLTIWGNENFAADTLAEYKNVADGDTTDDSWYGWVIPTTVVAGNIPASEGTLTVAWGDIITPLIGENNSITFTAAFTQKADAAPASAWALNPNQIQLMKDGVALGTPIAATDNSGTWTATFPPVDTKEWQLGEYKITAVFTGNNELNGATSSEVTVKVIAPVYAVYNCTKKMFYKATADAPQTPTEDIIRDSDKGTIHNLYIMGGTEVPAELMMASASLKTVTCAETVNKINSWAFGNCKVLTDAIMPNVPHIERKAFYNCFLLANIEMESVETIGDGAFQNCTSLASVNFPMATKIEKETFKGCTKLASVELLNAATIGEHAFDGCSLLDTVKIPKANTIGESAFQNCKELVNTNFSNATTIEANAFKDCVKLETTNFSNATTIGKAAFYQCIALKSIELPNATKIEESAFSYCTGLGSVVIPNATTLGGYAFTGCTGLVSVVIPNATTLGKNAFAGCKQLASLTLGATPPTVENNVFDSCPSPRNLIIWGNKAFETDILNAYKKDGSNETIWRDWTLPTTVEHHVSASAGTLVIKSGTANSAEGEDNPIIFTATFAKAPTQPSLLRTLSINQIQLMAGDTPFGTAVTALDPENDGTWTAEIPVNTKDLKAGKHTITAKFAGNGRLEEGVSSDQVTVNILPNVSNGYTFTKDSVEGVYKAGADGGTITLAKTETGYTFTFNNAKVNAAMPNGIELPTDKAVEVVLEGTNTINGRETENGVYIGGGDVTISGEGTLTSESLHTIWLDGTAKLNVKSGRIENPRPNGRAIRGSGSASITVSGGTIENTAGGIAVYSYVEPIVTNENSIVGFVCVEGSETTAWFYGDTHTLKGSIAFHDTILTVKAGQTLVIAQNAQLNMADYMDHSYIQNNGAIENNGLLCGEVKGNLPNGGGAHYVGDATEGYAFGKDSPEGVYKAGTGFIELAKTGTGAAEKHTFTFSNATVKASYDNGIALYTDMPAVAIELVGTNTIDGGSSYKGILVGSDANVNVTILGEGELISSSPATICLQGTASLNVQGVTISNSVASNGCAILNSGTGKITVSDGAQVTVSGENSNAISGESGDVEVTGSETTVLSEKLYAIICNKDVTVTDATIQSNGTEGAAIGCEGGLLTVTNAKITGENAAMGIYYFGIGTAKITGTTITTDGSVGISWNGNKIDIEDCIITAGSYTMDANKVTLPAIYFSSGIMTISETAAGKTKIISECANNECGKSTIYVETGKLTIDGGTVKNTAEGGTAVVIDADGDNANCEATINEGYLESNGEVVTLNQGTGNTAKLTINGGVIKRTGSGWAITNFVGDIIENGGIVCYDFDQMGFVLDVLPNTILKQNLEVEQDHMLNIDPGRSLTIAKGFTLTNNGTIMCKGTFVYGDTEDGTYGTLTGSGKVKLPATVTVAIKDETGNEVTDLNSLTYGDAVTMTATVKKNEYVSSLAALSNPLVHFSLYNEEGDKVSQIGTSAISFDENNQGTVTLENIELNSAKDVSAGTKYYISAAFSADMGGEATTEYFTLKQKELTVSGITAVDREYNGTEAVALDGTAALDGVEQSDEANIKLDQAQLKAAIADPNVGTGKAVTISGDIIVNVDNNSEMDYANNYYYNSTITDTVDISRANNTITASIADSVYGEELSPSHTMGEKDPAGEPTFTYEYAVEGESAYTTTAPKNTGSYTLRVTATETTNYNECSNIKNFAINKAPLTITGGEVSSKEWDGDTVATIDHITFGGLQHGEELALGTDYTVSEANFSNEDVGTDKPVTGTAELTASEKAKNYKLENGAFVNVKGEITLATQTSKPTNGVVNDTQGEDTFAFDKDSTIADIKAYEYSIDGGATWSIVTENPISIGNLAIAVGDLQVRVKATATHAAGQVLSNETAFTASLEGSVAVAGDTTYGETLTATATGAQGNAKLSYTWKTAEGAVLKAASAENTYSIDKAAINKNVTVEVTAKGYNGSLTDTTADAVAKRAITITPDKQTKKYGQPDPELTYKVTAGSIVNDDVLAGTLTRTAGEDKKDYAIAIGTLANDGYVITFVPANLSITAADVSLTVSLDPVSQKIGKEVIVTVTALNKDAEALVADTALPQGVTLSASDDTAMTLTPKAGTAGVYTAKYRAPDEVPNPATVTFTAAVSDTTGNYKNPENATADLTITEKNAVSMELTANKIKDVSYGDSVTYTAVVSKANPVINVLDKLDGEVNFYLGDPADGGELLGTKTIGTDTLEVTLEKETLTVGVHTVYAVYGGNKDYAAGRVNATTTVAQRQLTWDVSGLSALKKYDGDNTATVTGTLRVLGVQGNDELGFSYTSLSGEYANAEAGEQTVTVEVEGKAIENTSYLLPTENPTFIGKINEVVTGDTVIVPDMPENIELSIEREIGISTVPDDLKDNKELDTPAKIATYLQLQVSQIIEGIPTESVEVYDIKLMQSVDGGEPEEVTAENFPKEGITIVLPYPEGTKARGFEFVIFHMFTTGEKAGETEKIIPKPTKNGLEITVYSLSPFALGYKEVSSSGGSGGSDSDSDSSDEYDEYEFWNEIKNSISTAENGGVVKVDAKFCDKMPIGVMAALRSKNVGLVIKWNGGDTITIPAGKAHQSETNRIYYPLSMLAELYKGIELVENAKPTELDKLNPTTGGFCYVDASTGKATPVAGGVVEVAPTAAVAEASTNAPLAVTPPESGFEKDDFAKVVEANEPVTANTAAIFAGIALLLAGMGGVAIWKKKKEN